MLRHARRQESGLHTDKHLDMSVLIGSVESLDQVLDLRLVDVLPKDHRDVVQPQHARENTTGLGRWHGNLFREGSGRARFGDADGSRGL